MLINSNVKSFDRLFDEAVTCSVARRNRQCQRTSEGKNDPVGSQR